MKVEITIYNVMEVSNINWIYHVLIYIEKVIMDITTNKCHIIDFNNIKPRNLLYYWYTHQDNHTTDLDTYNQTNE